MAVLRTSWVERDTFRYPMQFFNPMSFVAPDIKSLFKWCEFFALSDPVIQSAIYKAAAYPVTDILVSSKEQKLADLVNDIFHNLDIKQICIVANVHLNVYGNAFVTVEMPFVRKFICTSCKQKFKADEIERLGLSNDYQFMGVCPKEKLQTFFDFEDIYVKNYDRLRVVLWNPQFIDIEVPFATAKPKYMYNVREYMENRLSAYKFDVLLAAPPGEVDYAFEESRRYLSDIPGIFIKALRTRLKAVFNNDLLLHVREPDAPGWSNIWGKPPMVSSLRDLYFYYVIRKSVEVLIKERTIPFRFLFPRSVTGDPALEINLGRMRAEITKMLKDMEFDPNIIGFLPIPYEMSMIGGDAHQLFPSLLQMLEYLEKRIIIGMGFPLEFVYGGMQWSGTSVSLRMLENLFINRRFLISNVLQFVKRIIALVHGFDENLVHVDFADMRMADDIARQRLIFELSQANVIPESVLLEDMGYDPQDIADEAVAHAKRKAKVLKETTKAQAEAQLEASKAEAFANPQLQYKMNMIAQSLQTPVEELYVLPPTMINILYQLMMLNKEDRDAYLMQLKDSKPGLYHLLKRFFKQQERLQTAQHQEQELPEQKPPRRQNEKKVI